jgi:hypothetical protein
MPGGQGMVVCLLPEDVVMALVRKGKKRRGNMRRPNVFEVRGFLDGVLITWNQNNGLWSRYMIDVQVGMTGWVDLFVRMLVDQERSRGCGFKEEEK